MSLLLQYIVEYLRSLEPEFTLFIEQNYAFYHTQRLTETNHYWYLLNQGEGDDATRQQNAFMLENKRTLIFNSYILESYYFFLLFMREESSRAEDYYNLHIIEKLVPFIAGDSLQAVREFKLGLQHVLIRYNTDDKPVFINTNTNTRLPSPSLPLVSEALTKDYFTLPDIKTLHEHIDEEYPSMVTPDWLMSIDVMFNLHPHLRSAFIEEQKNCVEMYVPPEENFQGFATKEMQSLLTWIFTEGREHCPVKSKVAKSILKCLFTVQPPPEHIELTENRYHVQFCRWQNVVVFYLFDSPINALHRLTAAIDEYVKADAKIKQPSARIKPLLTNA